MDQDPHSQNYPGSEKKGTSLLLSSAGPRKAILAVLVLGLVVGAIFGARWLMYYFTHATTDDARVKSDLVAISPTVSGKIRLLPIEEGDRVEKGQLVAQLREDDYRAEVERARGVLRAVEQELKEAEAHLTLVSERREKEVSRARAALNVAGAKLNEARAALQQASRDLERVKDLFQHQTVSQSEMDNAKTAYEVALARVESASEEVKEKRAQLQLARANTAEVQLKRHRVESLKGKLEEAQATLEFSRLKLEHTTVTSPIDGVVAKKLRHQGEVVKPGETVAVVVNPENVWVEANLKETKIQHVRVNQPVDLKVDAYPGVKFSGRVVNIGAAAASEFALIPENRSSGNFTKVTQRIPIKIEVLDPQRQLRPGMMVVVGIDTSGAEPNGKHVAEAGVKE